MTQRKKERRKKQVPIWVEKRKIPLVDSIEQVTNPDILKIQLNANTEYPVYMIRKKGSSRWIQAR